ncbi:hypothetical protein J7L00_07640 [Candidatus Bathyarchaeota archaeon]|nr:hypothetical protein [Candidatus Bathyarchaeota archaeon]
MSMDGSKFFPRRLSFPKICEILVAYLNAGADKEYVGINDVAKKSSVSLHNISRNNNFFKSWGFLEESEKEQGKYILNREAAEFAYAYRIDPKGEKTREILRRFLSKDEVLVKFVERIRREGLSRDSAILELPRIYGDLRADKVGLNAFLDMLVYAFGLEEISVPKEMPREAERSIRVVKPATRISEMRITPPEARLTININVTPEVSPQQLKEYVKAILEALRAAKISDA